MIKFRGTTKEGKGVKGWLLRTHFPDTYWIIKDMLYVADVLYGLNPKFPKHLQGCYQVLPSSLAMYTGIKDKNKAEIYGSFEVDGKMSDGGDEIMAVDEKRRVMWYFNRWVMRVIGTNCLREFHKNNICFYEVIPKETE